MCNIFYVGGTSELDDIASSESLFFEPNFDENIEIDFLDYGKTKTKINP